MLRSKQLAFSIALMFFGFSVTPSAPPFSFHRPSLSLKRKGGVQIFENPLYLILVSPTELRKEEPLPNGQKIDWVEVGYKMAVQTEEPEKLFGDSKEVLIQFKGPHDVVLASEKLAFADLSSRREAYGFLWMEAKKAKIIKAVSLERVESSKEKPAAESRPSGVESHPPVSLLPPLQGSPGVEAGAKGEVSDGFQRGGVTNDDVKKTLEAFEGKQPPQPRQPQAPAAPSDSSESENEPK